MRTQVAIIGAGPAGLTLARLLELAGIDSVVLEARSRQYVEERVRAGVLEQGTVDLLQAIGVGARLEKEGLVHHGIELRFAGEGRRIDMHALTGGRAITIYGQQEVVKDLITARLAGDLSLIFEVGDVEIHGITTQQPTVHCRVNGAEHRTEVQCDFVAGCDGFHGVSRTVVSEAAPQHYERVYPFGWLGILVAAPPPAPELIYCHHERGFSLVSMRSPEVSRLYLQCRPDENLAEWSDDRIWDELDLRLATGDRSFRLNRGQILQRGITDMRSYVVEPMQHGQLYLAGDAAHIVPPTGAKGLNLAVADASVLARALGRYYSTGQRDELDRYSVTCLRRVWRAQRFSWWMTSMLHRDPSGDMYDYKRQLAELDYVTSSTAAATTLAENYVG